MKRKAFEKLVAEAFDAIPEKFRPLAKNVAVVVENEPSEALRQQEGLGHHETLLGYYHGIPHTARGSEYGVGETYPDVITIFQRPIEEAANGDAVRIRAEIRETIWHEFAHHFGLDEGDIEMRERGQK
ncbi:MAG TPA: metallopeptidase family protein [Candidatus Paceibacterota bacterium]|jgi:predicted Zn-dependent protease with MMP-like domain